MSIINLVIFLGIVIFALVTSSYLTGLILVFALSIMEIAECGMTHFMFLLMCELTLTLFIIRETKLRKDNSPLLRYNPQYKGNILPLKVQLIVCAIFLLALIVRIIAFIHPIERDVNNYDNEKYQKDANSFINRIVRSHKMGEDYHQVDHSNPFTNDVFVCKVVSLLESEYERIDFINQAISKAIESSMPLREVELRRLSEECVKESSDVVSRINDAGIRKANASKMALDFSEQYMKLSTKCRSAITSGATL